MVSINKKTATIAGTREPNQSMDVKNHLSIHISMKNLRGKWSKIRIDIDSGVTIYDHSRIKRRSSPSQIEYNIDTKSIIDDYEMSFKCILVEFDSTLLITWISNVRCNNTMIEGVIVQWMKVIPPIMIPLNQRNEEKTSFHGFKQKRMSGIMQLSGETQSPIEYQHRWIEATKKKPSADGRVNHCE